MKLQTVLTLMLRELTEMIKILQEARKKTALHCINATIRLVQKVPIVRANTYDFFHSLRIGKVLIHDKSMQLTSNYIRLPILFEKQCI